MKKRSVSVVLWITIATLFGKLLGIVRDVLISYFYGSTNMTDAFFLSMSIPTIILGVFTASTDSAIIPQYNRIVKEKSRENADKLFSSIVNILTLVCGSVSVLMFVFPRQFISIFASGFDEVAVDYCVTYLRFFAPVGILHMLYCFFCTYNAAYKENLSRTVLAFLPSVIVVCVLGVWHDTRLIALSIAFLGTNIICAVLPMIQTRRLGYRHVWRIDRKDEEFQHFWKLFLPIMGGALLNDVQQYVDKNLASNVYGGISSLNYASKLVNIFDSIFIVGISVVLLPKLSEVRYEGDKKAFKNITTKVVKCLLMVLIPCFAVLFSLSEELITIFFKRGAFDDNAVETVATILRTYALLIVLMPVQTIFARFFHSIEKNKIPFWLNFSSVLLNTGLSIWFMNYWGVAGISFATTLATLITCIIYVEVIRRKIGWDKQELGIPKLVGMIALTILVCVSGRLIGKEISNIWLRIGSVAIVCALMHVAGYFLILRHEMCYGIKIGMDYLRMLLKKVKKH